jgi:hypothetical protein
MLTVTSLTTEKLHYVEERDKQIANVAEGSFATGEVSRGDFYLIKVAGKGAFLIAQLR